MSPSVLSRSRKSGLPPGTLVHVGKRRVERVSITVMDYDEGSLHEHTLNTIEECAAYLERDGVTWINITGIHDTDLLQRCGDIFGIHPLVLEDIVNTTQRPKAEDHGDYLFVVLKMLYLRPGDDEVTSEQVSLILGKRFVLTFQEIEGDVFDTIRNRIRTGGGRIRRKACDYLAYAIIDAIVDHYFVILEAVGDEIEAVHDEVVVRAEKETLARIHNLKHHMIGMRRILWPLRELVSTLEKMESRLLGPELNPYLRDVYSHTFQVIDSLDAMREMLSSAMEMYMTTLSNRMNEIMKTLTVIATIFIPLTFVAGVYGMNFDHMPELHWRYGYAAVWGFMLLSIGTMLLLFRRRRWL